jgi:hypothetical protein
MFAASSSSPIPTATPSTLATVSDLGRIHHYGEFYGLHGDAPAGRPEPELPLWLVVGNCQAEALRHALDAVSDRPYRTVRVPPVHELAADDLPQLHALLRRTAVLLTQPVRPNYRDLPLGTTQLTARLPKSARVLRWPVIRYAGLYPFQVIVRRPADRSIVPPPVPYHDLRTIAVALAGRHSPDPWDVDVDPAQLRAVAQASSATLAERERRGTDVGVSDVLASAGADAAHAINHPGNTVLATLARRALAELGVPARLEDSALGADPLLGSVYVPLEQRVLDALGIDGHARTQWQFHGESIDAERVHRIQMNWYTNNSDFLHLAVERHRSTMDLLGLSIGGAAR